MPKISFQFGEVVILILCSNAIVTLTKALIKRRLCFVPPLVDIENLKGALTQFLTELLFACACIQGHNDNMGYRILPMEKTTIFSAVSFTHSNANFPIITIYEFLIKLTNNNDCVQLPGLCT